VGIGGKQADETDGKIVSTGYQGGAKLIEALGVHPSQAAAFHRTLQRKRENRTLPDTSWTEVANPGPNAPQYLYQADAEPILKLAAKYQAEKDG
jgi:hypothetical protein